MFEMCAFLAPKKITKVRKASGPKIGVDAMVTVGGSDRMGRVTGRNTRFTNAWFVDFKIEGERVMSYSRNMIFVVVA